MTDYYTELGLDRNQMTEALNAQLSQLESLWKRRRIANPDKATVMLATIIEARKVFASEESRQAYDAELFRRGGSAPEASNSDGISSLGAGSTDDAAKMCLARGWETTFGTLGDNGVDDQGNPKGLYFTTDAQRTAAELATPYVFITDGMVDDILAILPLLEFIVNSKASLLMIANQYGGEVPDTLVLNKLRSIINVCPILAPSYGDRRRAILEDAATYTGGTVVPIESLKGLGAGIAGMLGRASYVRVDADSTLIVGGWGRVEDVRARIAELEAEAAASSSDFDRGKLRERIAELRRGIGESSNGN